MKIKHSILLMAMAMSLVACTKDKEDPVITITSPENHSHFPWGSTVDVTATFSDDQDLKYFKVYWGDEDGEALHPFMYEDEGSIEGESYDYSVRLDIPDTAHHDHAFFHFEVEDAEGKTATNKLMLHFE
jgi:hypothetical protein